MATHGGQLLTMPFVVLNMGTEMLYILNQRLQAQNVTDTKSHKVLLDVTRAMFSEVFIAELFKPQEMYNLPATKQIFEKLAHSSIMRLNKSSMDKLFDLMTMGFKYQILSCKAPVQILHVTLVHLECLRSICESTISSELIEVTVEKLINTYACFTDAQWMAVKMELLKCMQDRKVKVSLFLQKAMQGTNGELMPEAIPRLPFGTSMPGEITYYERGRVVRSAKVNIPSSEGDYIETATSILDKQSTIGKNLYWKEGFTCPEYDTASIDRAEAKLQEDAPFVLASRGGGSPSSYAERKFTRPRTYDVKSSAKAERNLLSDLLGVRSSSSKSKGTDSEDSAAKPLKLNLFPSSDMSKDDDDEGGATIMIDIDGASGAKSLHERMEDLDFGFDDQRGSGKHLSRKAVAKYDGDDSKEADAFDENAIDADDYDDDDLLALMDSAK